MVCARRYGSHCVSCNTHARCTECSMPHIYVPHKGRCGARPRRVTSTLSELITLPISCHRTEQLRDAVCPSAVPQAEREDAAKTSQSWIPRLMYLSCAYAACRPGLTARGLRCEACSPGTHKTQPGRTPCERCTGETYAPRHGMAECLLCTGNCRVNSQRTRCGALNPKHRTALCSTQFERVCVLLHAVHQRFGLPS